MKLRYSAFLALVIGLPLASLDGQETPPAPTPPGQPPAQPPAEVPGVKIRALAFQIDAPPTDVFAHDAATDGKTPGVKVDLKSYLNHEFSPLPVKGDQIVFTKSANPASVNETSALVGKAKVPSDFKRGIFMFLPGTGKPGDPAFRVLVIDDSLRSFPRGSLKVMNLSPLPVKIQLEKEVFEFKSGDIKVIEDPPVGPRNASAMVAQTFKNGQWQRIGSQVWPHPGDKRVLQVLFENPVSKQVELRGIRDVAVRNE